jgi:hypothetical protein
LLESAEAADFEHNGIRGDEHAASLARFFRERLPDKFGVEKGEAIDYRDTRTGQVDFVGRDDVLTGGSQRRSRDRFPAVLVRRNKI